MLSRRHFGGLAVALAGAAAVGSVAVRAASTDARPVEEASEAYRQAMVDADGPRLGWLAAPELSFGHSNGLVQTKDEFIGSVVNKDEIFRSIEHKDRKGFVVGDTGIVRYTFVADILLKGAPLNVSLGVIETWHKGGDRWTLVARQAYRT